MASRSLCRAQAPRSLAGRLCAESARGCGVRDAQARDAGSALTQGEWGVMLRGCCARGGSRAANKATEEPVTHTGIAAWRRCPPAPPPLLPCQPLPLLAPSQHRALYIPAARPAPPRACTAQAGAAGGGGGGGPRGAAATVATAPRPIGALLRAALVSCAAAPARMLLLLLQARCWQAPAAAADADHARTFGPSVTCTASASFSTPASRPALHSSPKRSSLAA